MPAKTFRERVAVLKGLRDYCVLAATDGRKCCDECASGWEQRVEALDAVLALCEDGGTPDAWRNDPKVKACIGNLRAQECYMEDDRSALLDLLRGINLKWTNAELLADTILASGFRQNVDGGTSNCERCEGAAVASRPPEKPDK